MTDKARALAPVLLALAALAACAPKPATPAADAAKPAAAQAPAAQDKNTAPAGDYVNDPAHTSLVFRVSHMGFSNFTARFTKVDAKLKFDPANPAAMQLDATIDPRSIASDNAPAGFMAELAGPQWLDAAKYPQIAFHSTKVEPTGANTAHVTGDLSLHGVTKPVTLDVTFNGGYPGMALDPKARIGFSAKGQLKRSDFGVAYGIPAPGTTMGVGDTLDLVIETELQGPPLAKAG